MGKKIEILFDSLMGGETWAVLILIIAGLVVGYVLRQLGRAGDQYKWLFSTIVLIVIALLLYGIWAFPEKVMAVFMRFANWVEIKVGALIARLFL